MLFQTTMKQALICAGLLASQAAADCYDSETPKLMCYTAANGTPQNVAVADITYIAGYLRNYGRKNPPGLWTMPAEAPSDFPNCDEWSVYVRRSALVVAKHIDPTVNSSILFEDIATALDGGEKAPADAAAAAIIGCKTDGGAKGYYNATNPAYKTLAYNQTYATPAGILIKVVAAPTV